MVLPAMKEYRVGIIGLSDISIGTPRRIPHPSLGGDTAYSHAAAYDQLPQCKVVAVCDLSQQRREAFLQRWGQRWPEVAAYEDGRTMLAEVPLDLVSIATPDHLHKEFVLAACEVGVKGIICEKPLATNLADCDEMIAAVKRHSVKLNVEHTRRWIGTWQDAKATIMRGEIGQLHHLIGFMGGPRAMMFRNGTHIVDLLNFLAGGNPIWVSAEIEAGYDHYRSGYQGDGGHAADSEPGANAIICYDNGVRATYIGMKGSVADVAVTAIGSKGRIAIDTSGEVLTLMTDRGMMSRSLQYGSDPLRHEYMYTGITGAITDVIRAIETGEPTISPPEEGRKAVAVLLAMLESHFTGGKRVPVAGPPTADA
jgi:predicted dehydrogenase